MGLHVWVMLSRTSQHAWRVVIGRESNSSQIPWKPRRQTQGTTSPRSPAPAPRVAHHTPSHRLSCERGPLAHDFNVPQLVKVKVALVLQGLQFFLKVCHLQACVQVCVCVCGEAPAG